MCKKNWSNLLLGIGLLFLFVNPSYGQLAIIQDEDGYVNVRKEPSGKSEVMTRLYDGDVFWFYEEAERPWYEITFDLEKVTSRNGKHYEEFKKRDGTVITPGYMHKSRILPIENLADIASREIANDKLILKGAFIDVSFHFRDFHIENHTVAYFEENPSIVSSIDGKWARGVDGNLPTREIQLIKFFWDKQEIKLPHSAYIDLYQPSPQGISLKEHKGYVYLTMFGNSDGAGGYDCVWIFKDKKYLGRYVDAP